MQEINILMPEELSSSDLLNWAQFWELIVFSFNYEAHTMFQIWTVTSVEKGRCGHQSCMAENILGTKT